ncbi:uncharacterized protein BP5553_10505 [Venustampulla echinocandica]|uniref:Protein kinase domain-containing protein n=1 Tax=Venustampulla echinocandica TaxID=2656787 RepID=A0A370T9H5_9HELO|nr:uncharacterized protein BP5553_10505 [Venustampulla echinocandica]RDL30227.1 hypothetical protein BP5553_10505 [Venustampulla echinocandica]
MLRIPDLVLDSKLHTQFSDSATIHSFLETDRSGDRSCRKEYWRQEKLLGRGGFGEVRLERCVTAGAKQDALRAVKVIKKQLITGISPDLNRELEAIAKFSQDRYQRWFVKSFGWYEVSSSIFITMEYCRHGDLHHYLSNRRSLPAAEAQQLTYQILEGLHHMHENDFAHRDLKPGNILIKLMPPEKNWWVVLADFGISKRGDESNEPTTAIKGTNGFMAPELLGVPNLTRPKHISGFKAADMWALGEIAFRMLTGEVTFQSQWELMEYCQGKRTFPSDRLPSSARLDGEEFVSSLMETFPSNRMTTAQCLKHHWMESQHINLIEEPTKLNLEQNGSPGFAQSDMDRNDSARWSDISAPESEPVQTTAQRRQANLSDSYQMGSRQTQLKQVRINPPIPQNPGTSNESLLKQDMALDVSQNIVVALSLDGKTLAAARRDYNVWLWDNWSGKVLRTLKGHINCVNAVAFSPDGKTLASASNDYTVKLWDSQSGVVLRTLEGYKYWVTAVAFSPDGKTLASASDDNTVKLWDSQSGVVLRTLEGHEDWVTAVAFSPDGKTLASASDDYTVKLWDSQSGVVLRTLEGHKNWVTAVAFSPDGKTLASASSDYTVKLWDSQSGVVLRTLEGRKYRVAAVAFTPDGKTLASASRDHDIRLWDSQSGAVLRTLEGHKNWVIAVAFSPDGKTLVSVSWDLNVMLWDGRSGARIRQNMLELVF